LVSGIPLKHRQQRQTSLSWVLGATELPGDGWVTINEIARRSGVGGKDDISRRAYASGMMTAEKTFRQPRSGRSVAIYLFPYATSEDALQALPTLSYVRNPFSRVTTYAEHVVDDIEVNSLDNPWCYERLTVRLNYSSSVRFVGGTADSIVFVVMATDERGTGWLWDDVIKVATVQSHKLKRKHNLHEI
jgi:hypothetical protein